MRQLTKLEGRFGLIRILERIDDGARAYVTGASYQTLIDAAGTSLFGYVNAFKILLRGRKTVLMFGGGGGSLATMLARKGKNVTVVDIDPLAEQLARDYFQLDPKVTWHTADALTYLADSPERFDAIVVDACTSLRTQEAFTDPDWLCYAAQHLTAGGLTLINLAYDDTDVSFGRELAQALADRGLHTSLYLPDDGWEGNELLLASDSPIRSSLALKDILERPSEAQSYLMSLRQSRYDPKRSCIDRIR